MRKVLLISLFILSFNVFAFTQQDEINYLLDTVASTDCKYERNGTLHNGAEAVKHINKKYVYFADDIKSTEDFIQYSATKSSLSGKYYKIHCVDKRTIKSKDWLLMELHRYRKNKK